MAAAKESIPATGPSIPNIRKFKGNPKYHYFKLRKHLRLNLSTLKIKILQRSSTSQNLTVHYHRITNQTRNPI